MIKAVIRNGAIEPLEPVPPEWSDGRRLVINEAIDASTDEDLDLWNSTIESLASQISDDDFAALETALQQADRDSKDIVRRQMGLS